MTWRIANGWAPPARVWGPWIEIGGLFGGPLSYKVKFETISNAPSTFDAEIQYWKGGMKKNEMVIGPGAHVFTAGVCVCVSKIRFRSHSVTGQAIKIKINP